ncbi:MAG: hypothetical protein WA931_01500 [Rhodococcus sp. (in: high G+C Gram-positive bacteria)]
MSITIVSFTIIALIVIALSGTVLALLLRDSPTQRARSYPIGSYEESSLARKGS